MWWHMEWGLASSEIRDWSVSLRFILDDKEPEDAVGRIGESEMLAGPEASAFTS